MGYGRGERHNFFPLEEIGSGKCISFGFQKLVSCPCACSGLSRTPGVSVGWGEEKSQLWEPPPTTNRVSSLSSPVLVA